MSSDTVVSADVIYSLGRDLNTRPRVNQRILGSTVRRISALLPTALNPNTNANRPALSVGKAEYKALILGLHRRLSKGVEFMAGYKLSSALSNIGVGVDQLNTANIQNPDDPWDAPVQFGPTADTDARHAINISGSFTFPSGIRFSPVYLLALGAANQPRSTAAISTWTATRWRFRGGRSRWTSFDLSKPLLAQTTFKDIGVCETVNCGRGMPQHQMNFRLSKIFNLSGRARIEAIGEVFNVFNAANPGGFRARAVVPTTGAAGSAAPAADQLLGRLPSSGAARRTDRGQVQLLEKAGKRDRQERREGKPSRLFFPVQPFLPILPFQPFPAHPALRSEPRNHLELLEVMDLMSRHLVNQPVH